MLQKRSLDALQIIWDEFHEMMYEAYFPSSVKKKLEDDLNKLQQGDQSVQEYT